MWSLGVEVEGGVMDALMPRNTIVTNHKCREYATAVDNQTAMTIKVMWLQQHTAAASVLLLA